MSTTGMDFNVQAESARGAVAVGGATVSAITMNEVVTVLTIVYLAVVLFNATPKLIDTFKHWREVFKSKRRNKGGGKR